MKLLAFGLVVLGVGMVVAAWKLAAQLKVTTDETVRTREAIAQSPIGKYLIGG